MIPQFKVPPVIRSFHRVAGEDGVASLDVMALLDLGVLFKHNLNRKLAANNSCKLSLCFGCYHHRNIWFALNMYE